MKPAFRELLVAAEGAGELEGDDVGHGEAEHPICGDRVAVTCRVSDRVVRDYAWQAEGCPATLAVAAASYTAWVGCPSAELEPRLRERLLALGGLATHERHAEKMLLRAIAAAVDSIPT